MTQAHDSARLAGLGTEAVRPDLSDLDERSTADLVRLAIDEHHAVDAAREQAAPALEAAVDAVSARMRRGGRLVYLGAGTPGRLAALDAAECPPTYGTDPDLVVAVVAGGAVGVARSTEHSEDEGDAAVAALEELAITDADSVVGVTASGRTPYVVLAAVATAGSVMVSYARARAESLIPLCKVGFMERPERLVLLIIGGFFNRMGPVLWVIAVVSTITVIHRIVYTWQETRAGRVLPGIRLSL